MFFCEEKPKKTNKLYTACSAADGHKKLVDIVELLAAKLKTVLICSPRQRNKDLNKSWSHNKISKIYAGELQVYKGSAQGFILVDKEAFVCTVLQD